MYIYYIKNLYLAGVGGTHHRASGGAFQSARGRNKRTGRGLGGVTDERMQQKRRPQIQLPKPANGVPRGRGLVNMLTSGHPATARFRLTTQQTNKSNGHWRCGAVERAILELCDLAARLAADFVPEGPLRHEPPPEPHRRRVFGRDEFEGLGRMRHGGAGNIVGGTWESGQASWMSHGIDRAGKHRT